MFAVKKIGRKKLIKKKKKWSKALVKGIVKIVDYLILTLLKEISCKCVSKYLNFTFFIKYFMRL